MENMENEDLQSLNMDDQHIKSLDLIMLNKISPQCEHKHKEVLRQLEKLEKERNILKQSLVAIRLKKSELEKLFLKMKAIYHDLGVRETKTKQELAKATVMCPIYKFQMSHFLEETGDNENESADSIPYPNGSVIQENLTKEKRKMEDLIEYKQNIIENFIKEYLD